MAPKRNKTHVPTEHKPVDVIIKEIDREQPRHDRASPTLQCFLDKLVHAVVEERKEIPSTPPIIDGSEVESAVAPIPSKGSLKRARKAALDGNDAPAQLVASDTPVQVDEQWTDQVEMLKHSVAQYSTENERLVDTARLLREHGIALKADNAELRRQAKARQEHVVETNRGAQDDGETRLSAGIGTRPSVQTEIQQLRQSIADMSSTHAAETKRFRQSLKDLKANHAELKTKHMMQDRERRSGKAGDLEEEEAGDAEEEHQPQQKKPKQHNKKSLKRQTNTAKPQAPGQRHNDVSNPQSNQLVEARKAKTSSGAGTLRQRRSTSDRYVLQRFEYCPRQESFGMSRPEAAASANDYVALEEPAERPSRQRDQSTRSAGSYEAPSPSEDFRAPWHPDSQLSAAQTPLDAIPDYAERASLQPRATAHKRKRRDSYGFLEVA